MANRLPKLLCKMEPLSDIIVILVPYGRIHLFKNRQSTFGVIVFVIESSSTNVLYLSVRTKMSWLLFSVFDNVQSSLISISSIVPVGGNIFLF